MRSPASPKHFENERVTMMFGKERIIRGAGTSGEFIVGLIDQKQNMGMTAGKPRNFSGRKQRAGGIVRVGQVDHFGAAVDGGSNIPEGDGKGVVLPNQPQAGAGKFSELKKMRISGERGHHSITGIQIGLAGQCQGVVGAVGEHDLFGPAPCVFRHVAV